MPTPKYIYGMPGDECQCGRRATIRHCPSCGSTRLYAYSTEQYKEFPDKSGNPIYRKVRLYRCNSCPTKFTEEEREFCAAPPIAGALAKLRIQNLNNAVATGEAVTPVEDQAVKSLRQLIADPVAKQASHQEKYYNFVQWQQRLRLAYIDHVEGLKADGKDIDCTEEEFIDKGLAQFGIERVEKLE